MPSSTYSSSTRPGSFPSRSSRAPRAARSHWCSSEIRCSCPHLPRGTTRLPRAPRASNTSSRAPRPCRPPSASSYPLPTGCTRPSVSSSRGSHTAASSSRTPRPRRVRSPSRPSVRASLCAGRLATSPELPRPPQSSPELPSPRRGRPHSAWLASRTCRSSTRATRRRARRSRCL